MSTYLQKIQRWQLLNIYFVSFVETDYRVFYNSMLSLSLKCLRRTQIRTDVYNTFIVVKCRKNMFTPMFTRWNVQPLYSFIVELFEHIIPLRCYGGKWQWGNQKKIIINFNYSTNIRSSKWKMWESLWHFKCLNCEIHMPWQRAYSLW